MFTSKEAFFRDDAIAWGGGGHSLERAVPTGAEGGRSDLRVGKSLGFAFGSDNSTEYLCPDAEMVDRDCTAWRSSVVV